MWKIKRKFVLKDFFFANFPFKKISFSLLILGSAGEKLTKNFPVVLRERLLFEGSCAHALTVALRWNVKLLKGVFRREGEKGVSFFSLFWFLLVMFNGNFVCLCQSVSKSCLTSWLTVVFVIVQGDFVWERPKKTAVIRFYIPPIDKNYHLT